MNKLIAGAVAGIVILLAGVYLLAPQGSAPGLDLITTGAAEAQEVDTSGIAELTMGDAEAPVTVIEYASFTCPHCRNFHEGPFKQLKADYIDTGKVHFIYRDVYFDRYGLWAAMVARCGGPERFFGLADLIYENQREWLSSGDPVQIAGDLRRLGRTAGLSDDELNACLNDGEKAQALVALYQQNASADGISSTPSFMINGQRYANMSYAELSNILDEAADDS